MASQAVRPPDGASPIVHQPPEFTGITNRRKIMKRILIVLASIAAFVLPMLAFAPAAQAQMPTGVVTNGMAWVPNPNAVPNATDPPYCTLGLVGTDSSGNKIAISARHCVEAKGMYFDGAPVYRWLANGTAGAQFGTIAHRSSGTHLGGYGTDWVVIKLNADADLFSNGPGARIDGIGNPPAFPQVLCKDGVTTGVKCGVVTGTSPGRIASIAFALGGDSGGPAWIDTNYGKIVGLVRGPGEFISIHAVLSEINSGTNPVGKGLVVTNN
ncbi:hypothetical protein AB4Z09_12800 [Rhodococcus sp. TAF43]|uniref:hypothetical protein n=1 Tax=Rhodococcus sp. TAF43 TaxID=3237483 RepID=UPI003F98D84C